MKLHRFLVAAFATLAFVACDNNQTDDPDPNEKPDGEVTYTIAADKETFEADGVDCVTFSVFDKDGNDIALDADMLKKIYFVNANTDQRLERNTKTFSSIRNGEFTFYATIRGVRTSNEVTVTAQNRATYEKYVHKVCVYQCTATWCGYCPQMTEGLHKLREGVNGNNVIILACHAQDNYALPWGNYDLGTTVCVNNGGSGYPYAVYDMAFGAGQRTESFLNSTIESHMMACPSTCGVKISKATMDGAGNVELVASVEVARDGEYDLGYAVLADNQPRDGGNEEQYHDVVAAVSSNFMKMSNDTKVSLKAGEEYTKTFTFKVEPFTAVNVAFNPSNYKVVVFAHSNANAGVIDNANTCAFGQSVDYEYTK